MAEGEKLNAGRRLQKHPKHRSTSTSSKATRLATVLSNRHQGANWHTSKGSPENRTFFLATGTRAARWAIHTSLKSCTSSARLHSTRVNGGSMHDQVITQTHQVIRSSPHEQQNSTTRYIPATHATTLRLTATRIGCTSPLPKQRYRTQKFVGTE